MSLQGLLPLLGSVPQYQGLLACLKGQPDAESGYPASVKIGYASK